MKKRVLSLLLMLVMVVTAVPFFAFPAAAAEEETDAPVEFDYDKLYYTSGLIYSIDFFKSNLFWDPEGDDFTPPVNPSENTAYSHAGTLVDLTVEANRVAGTELSPAYKAAVASWKSAEKTFLNLFTVKAANGTYMFSYAPKEEAANAKYFHSAFTLEAGYIQIRDDVHSSGGVQLAGFGSAANFTDNTAMHIVYDRAGTENNPHILWHNFRLAFGSDGKLTGVGAADNFAVAENGLTATAPVDFDGITNIVLQQTGGATEGGEDTFSIWDGSGVLASAKGTYVGNANFKAVVYFGWSNTMSGGKIYAIRQYNEGLDAAGYAQNSFADLCKWYKLDMGLYGTLTAPQALTLRDTILAFATEKGIEVGGDADDRALLQEKFSAATVDIIYSELTDADNSPEAAAFAAVAKAVGADISGVLALPADPTTYRQAVYAAVLGMTETQKASKKAVEDMINTMIDTIIETYFGQYINKTDLTYKDLYVKQENIALWLDFFAAREADGNLYMDVSYSDVGTKADGSPLPSGYTKNWDLPTWKDGKASNGRNPDKIFITQISGEAEARAKYIYKGGEFFEFADIPDAKWGHTNIRTWGNGKLICGLNNSFRVKSPGVNETQVTYQFVTGWENNDTKNADGMNIQLDGYRMNFTMDAGNTEGMFEVPSYTYYGYGVATDNYTLNNNALMTGKPNAGKIYVGDMLDLTVTVDKNLGTDEAHYYMDQYLTNDDGAIQYYENDTPPVALTINSVPKLFRYQIDGAWYYLRIETSGGTTTYTARFGETMVGKAKRLTHDGYVVESVPVLRNGDTMSFDWDNAVYLLEGEEKVEVKTDIMGKELDQLATTVYGPCYKNPFPEVPFGTPGATGPINYKGTYELGVYANGSQYMYATGLSYQASDIGWVGNSGNMTFYAVRTYNCVLSESEIKQNHFADLAGYYGFDLAPYSLLSDSERAALHNDLATLQLGLDYEDGIEEYEAAIDAYLYNFDLEIPGAENFLGLCHAFGLNSRTLKELSPESLARIFAEFADMDPTARNYAPIVQKKVDEVVNAEIEAHYASAYGHKSITFEGWQVRKTGAFGLRALYSTDLSLVPRLEDAGAKIYTGVLMAKKSADFDSIEDLSITVENGEVVIPAGATLAKGYWDGELAPNATKKGSTLYFSYDIILDGADEETLAAQMKELYFYAGFTAIVVGEGADQHVSIFYDDATLDGGKTGAQSLQRLARAAQKHKVSEPNIQATLNLLDVYEGDPVYIAIEVGGRTLSDYKVVYSSEQEALSSFQNTLKMTMGFELDTVRAADTVGKSGFVYIGTMDNVYGDKCYGVSVLNGNLYFWYNSDAEAADATELLVDYLLAKQEAGENVSLPSGFEIVNRVVD